MKDDTFSGHCPTCGQRYLMSRVKELEAQVNRLVALKDQLLAELGDVDIRRLK